MSKSRTDIRKQKYRYIVNLTGSSDIARLGREWSYERINSTFGLKIDELSRLPRIKELTNRQKRVRFYKFNAIIDSPRELIPPRFKIVKNKSRIKLKSKKRKKTKKVKKLKSDKDIKVSYDDLLESETLIRDSDVDLYASSSSRAKSWANWSRDDFYPPIIHQMASKSNKEAGKDENDRYGWAVAYYMFTEEMSMEDVTKLVTPSLVTDDFYSDEFARRKTVARV